ncbi:uncharacterized protein LTR77_006810 [Saxophila tyrrhenica]|uniref:C2H2-type domain-containing protein n=1 Tax=Saxophila tyrrhenica TaxID=1690608 RepID=A0AAV9PA12_9PEZI|nr:hypothetical protein LTR77_006810 [Saxophila tyrrhenica]
MDDPNAHMYPPIPDATTGVMSSAYPPMPVSTQMPPQQMPPQSQQQQIYPSSDSPHSEPSRVSTVSTTSNAKPQPKKNQYPCPMAKQFGCADFFTTSGHAARHAKKHTGKKDAYCPECNKAFTRKDNMEQHRRTHQNGRGAAARTAPTSSDEAKVKKPVKTPKKSAVKAEPQQLEAAVEQQLAEQAQPMQMPMSSQMPQSTQGQLPHNLALDQALMMPGGGPYFLNGNDTGPIPALPNVMPDLNMRPQLHRANFTTNLDYVPPMAAMGGDPNSDLHYSYPSPGLSNGLNSLALAASEHRRLSEEKEAQSPQDSHGTPSEQT